MTLPSDIPEAVAERAAILMDTHRHVGDDLEYTARIIMAVEAAPTIEPDRCGLTTRQANALAFIGEFITRHEHSPTYAEIADGLGLMSRSSAHRVVQILKERGVVRSRRGRRQSLFVVREQHVSDAHKNSVEA